MSETATVPAASRSKKAVEPALLEALGKKASIMYLEKGVNLNDAVTKLASAHELGVNHVRRVVEFANNATHTSLYASSKDKTFSFPVADAEAVIQDMHDGAGDKIPVLSEKDQVESAMPKAASFGGFIPGIDSATLEQAFAEEMSSSEKTAGADYQHINPHGQLSIVLDRLQAASDGVSSQRDSTSMLMDNVKGQILYGIKQASLYGMTLKDVYGALEKVAKSKAILQEVCAAAHDSLKAEFHYLQQDQTVKTASGNLNLEHPLVKAYELYEDLSKRFQVLEKAASILSEQEARVNKFLRGKLAHAQPDLRG